MACRRENGHQDHGGSDQGQDQEQDENQDKISFSSVSKHLKGLLGEVCLIVCVSECIIKSHCQGETTLFQLCGIWNPDSGSNKADKDPNQIDNINELIVIVVFEKRSNVWM